MRASFSNGVMNRPTSSLQPAQPPPVTGHLGLDPSASLVSLITVAIIIRDLPSVEILLRGMITSLMVGLFVTVPVASQLAGNTDYSGYTASKEVIHEFCWNS